MGAKQAGHELARGCMTLKKLYHLWLASGLMCFAAVAANAQSCRGKCTNTTNTHPVAAHTEPQ